jgi:hypothetical protein
MILKFETEEFGDIAIKLDVDDPDVDIDTIDGEVWLIHRNETVLLNCGSFKYKGRTFELHETQERFLLEEVVTSTKQIADFLKIKGG